MVSKSASDETNDTGKDIHTEVSNKSSGHVPSPEHTEGKNKKVSKEEFEATRDKILNGSYATWQQGKQYLQKMWDEAYHKATHTLNCENCVGDVLKNCRNSFHCFEGEELEDGAYTVSFGSGSKDIWHSYSTG